MRKYTAIVAMSAAALIIAAGLLLYLPYSTTVVLVVRHAERNNSAPNCTASADCSLPTGNPPNPPLSAPPAGQIARADELAHVVEDAGIQAIYASCFCRTQQTVQTAANNLGLTPILVSQHAPDGSVDVADLVARIKTNNVGQTVLVAGHSETVGEIIKGLGGGTIDPIGISEFDNLYVVTITRGWWRWWFGYGTRVRVVRLKYGAAT